MAGGKCTCCHKQLLVVIRGATVCTVCDNVRGWPKGTG